jgi:hypothetical protein
MLKKTNAILWLLMTFSVFTIASIAFDSPSHSSAQTTRTILGNGTVEYEGTHYIFTPSTSNPYGIETEVNMTISEETQITWLSDTIVSLQIEMDYSMISTYQELEGTRYYPESYGLRFYGEEDDLLGTGNPPYTLTRQVNSLTGKYTLAQNPYGASYFVYAAYFDEAFLYEWVSSFPTPFTGVGDQSGVFLANATTLEVGDEPVDNYTISGYGEYMGYETLILQPSESAEGFTVHSDINHFERETGLFLTQTTHIETEDFAFKYRLSTTDFNHMIVTITDLPDASPALDPILILVGGGGAIAVVILLVILRQKR